MAIPAAAQRLVEAGRGLGLEVEVTHFPAGTKTALEAAAAIGCPVAAIVKSLVFLVDAEPVVALVPGDRRLDPERLASLAGGSQARRASLEEVRDSTGYAAGGTPPFGHRQLLRVFADPDLRRNDPLWAAGGTPNTVFPLRLADLEEKVRPVWGSIAS
jgi:prolyl-tRNA editing enzyme YbaK/EbsC (Cys-tRNA(Pro) deacylase)